MLLAGDAPYKSKVLVVDDKDANLIALANLLSSDDVQIVTAQSGNDALALLLEQDFALALLDVQMPIINGFEVAKLMRSSERSRNTPIIFVTASERRLADKYTGYSTGAVDYLLKPLVPHEVRSKVRVFVELDQKSKALSAKLKEVERLKEIAESGSRSKGLFLANMSHEIRTPLGSIIGYADLLALSDAEVSDEMKLCVSGIQRNGRILQALIDDILDLSKIEADSMQVDLQYISLGEVIRDIKAVHQHRAAEKGLEFSVVPVSALPTALKTDPVLVRQVLNNLIGNAVKFTSQGGVSVEIEYQTSGILLFRIKDTGYGLSPEEKSQLFQAFIQGDSSTKRRFGGTGLGLAISKKLAKLLGGDIFLESSERGRGSVFGARFFVGEVHDDDLIQPLDIMHSTQDLDLSLESFSEALKELTILVVDDVEDNRIFVRRFLEIAGAVVKTASSGRMAVEMVLASDFDIVIMDIQMPEIDGIEAVRMIREAGKTMPVIALSAHAMKDEMENCITSGFSSYMSKPIRRKELIDKIKAYAKKVKN